MLFVPADNPELVMKAAQSEADAIIVDLEDAVSVEQKSAARHFLSKNIVEISGNGAGVILRVNSGWRDLMNDLGAGVRQGVDAVMIPKVENAGNVGVIADIIGEFEMERGLDLGFIKIIALIESPAGLDQAYAVASVSRVAGLALGTEDFSLAMGVPPTAEMLDMPVRQIALAANASGCMSFAIPLSIAEFQDSATFEHAARKARAIGCSGALCIHPKQVRITNQVFMISESERDEAHAIVAAWDQTVLQGKSVGTRNGKMIDKPVLLRARRLLTVSKMH